MQHNNLFDKATVILTLRDFSDASRVANLLVENGYTVLLGPDHALDQGVKVRVYEARIEKDPKEMSGGPLDG